MTISIGLALILVVGFVAAFWFVSRFAPTGTIRTGFYVVLGFLAFVVLLWAFGLLSSQTIRVR